MIAPDLDSAIARLQELVHVAGSIVPFTGAGISTECGIPDFRSPGGLWTKNRPIPFDEFISSQEARNESWRRRFAMEEQFAAARPGRGHRAIASLYRAGKVPAVVTQNIDNLHQAFGIRAEDIVELHGNTTFAHCLDCNGRFELQWVRRHMDAGNGCAPSHSAKPCPMRRCGVRRISCNRAIFWFRSALRLWFGPRPDFPSWRSAAALCLSSSIAKPPISMRSPTLLCART
jgi:NAD-dependent deacetylase